MNKKPTPQEMLEVQEIIEKVVKGLEKDIKFHKKFHLTCDVEDVIRDIQGE